MREMDAPGWNVVVSPSAHGAYSNVQIALLQDVKHCSLTQLTIWLAIIDVHILSYSGHCEPHYTKNSIVGLSLFTIAGGKEEAHERTSLHLRITFLVPYVVMKFFC